MSWNEVSSARPVRKPTTPSFCSTGQAQRGERDAAGDRPRQAPAAGGECWASTDQASDVGLYICSDVDAARAGGGGAALLAAQMSLLRILRTCW